MALRRSSATAAAVSATMPAAIDLNAALAGLGPEWNIEQLRILLAAEACGQIRQLPFSRRTSSRAPSAIGFGNRPSAVLTAPSTDRMLRALI